ncbi:MAG TPA: phage tail protein, partial [Actinophytocola sp.]|uniref:phage tail protein n=1 Tax=Actinophytocola sp. TaxID=1872138 RepID=UPI002DDD015C
MALPELDKAVGHSFGLEIDGVQIKQISEVSGLKMEQDVIELKQNTPDGKYVIKKLPGKPKAGEVTLTRPLTEDQSFEKWCKDARFGKMGTARKGGAIILYDQEGTAFKRYK